MMLKGASGVSGMRSEDRRGLADTDAIGRWADTIAVAYFVHARQGDSHSVGAAGAARRADYPAVIDLTTLDGIDGFRIDGASRNDFGGFSVSSAGDVNGDGFDDIVIGAYRANPDGVFGVGASYIVFGKASAFAARLDLATLDGTNGFRVDGIDKGDESGRSASSAGDINGDGFDDIILGARGGDPGGDSSAGESYVVFGKADGFAASLDLATLDGSNGFASTASMRTTTAASRYRPPGISTATASTILSSARKVAIRAATTQLARAT